MMRLFDKAKRPGLIRDSIVAFVVRGLGAVSVFFMSFVVARILPVDESGFFFLSLSIINVLAAFGLMGLHQAVLRFIGAHYGENDWKVINAVVRKSLWWASSCLFVLSLGLYFSSHWVAEIIFAKPPLGAVLQAFSPGLFFIGLSMLVAYQLQAIHRTSQSIVILSIATPLGAGLCLLWFRLDLASLMSVLYSLCAMATMVIGVALWRKYRQSSEPADFDSDQLWASSFPLWIVVLMNQAVLWSGQFVAGAWVPAEHVAYLAVAQRTAMLVSFILIAVNLVVAPRFASLYKQNRLEEIEYLALSATRIMTAFALPVIFFLLLFPDWVMSWFGAAYREGAFLLMILAVAQFVNVITGSVGNLLIMSGHERDMRNAVLVSGLLAMAGALLLTPRFGVTGAAIATALAVASQNLLAVHLVKRRLGFNTLAIWKRAV